jgi:hypothetical protein
VYVGFGRGTETTVDPGANSGAQGDSVSELARNVPAVMALGLEAAPALRLLAALRDDIWLSPMMSLRMLLLASHPASKPKSAAAPADRTVPREAGIELYDCRAGTPERS